MAPEDLPQFLPRLEAAGALRRISASVDPVLEIAAIVDRVVRRPGGGPALLFERVTGSDFPLITNLYGSGQRMAAALGHGSLEAASARIASALAATPEGFPAWRLEQACASHHPRPVPASGLSHVVDTPDLGILPALHSWPDDGGRFLTLAQVFTRHPETLSSNCGLYRV
ncbi:MAG: UbiD family decarboxylase, partial [Desulfuromonadales bacterium]|nr:UbiD family decarboxylase [Desulfuromonadales bacterium]